MQLFVQAEGRYLRRETHSLILITFIPIELFIKTVVWQRRLQ